MAEVLGVVSGVVGIAGFSLQIIDNVQKLKFFLKKLRFAHAHLEDLLNELDLLATLISESDLTGPPDFAGGPEDASRTPFSCCEKAARNTLSALGDIQNSFKGRQKHGTWTNVQFVLREKQLECNLKKLERAKSMLLLAQQYLLQHQLHQMHQSQGRDISDIKKVLMASHANVKSQIQRGGTDQSLGNPYHKTVHSSYNLLFGTLLIAKSNNHKQTRRTRFSPATWLSWAWGFEVLQRTAFGRPQFLYRTFNIVPRDSPIRVACARGNQPEIEQMFSKGLATPFDVTTEGSTLLHTAAAFHRVDTCKMLLDYGVDVSAASSIEIDPAYAFSVVRRTPLMMAISPATPESRARFAFRFNEEVNQYESEVFFELEDLVDFQPNPHDALETIKVLIDRGSHSPLDDYFYDEYRTAADFLLPFEDSMNYVFTHIEDVTLDDVPRATHDLCTNGTYLGRDDLFAFGMKLINHVLNSSSHSWPSIENDIYGHLDLLGTVLHILVIAKSNHIPAVEAVLSKLISKGILLYWEFFEDPWGQMEVRTIDRILGPSLLWTMLHSDGLRPVSDDLFKQSRNLAIQSWLLVLKDYGVNLRKYLEYERQIYLAIPYWVRTNTNWFFDANEGHRLPWSASENVCEIILDFDLDNDSENPSVSMRLQKIDMDPDLMVAEIEKILGEKREVPGQWVELPE